MIRAPGHTTLVLAVTLGLGAPAAMAHDLWVNASSYHDPEGGTTSVVTSMGWGHTPMPVAEFLNGAQLETYAVVAPDGSTMALPFDAAQNADVNMIPDADAPDGLASMQGGDTFTRRLQFDDAAQEGAWRAHVGLPARVYSTWLDADGQRVSGSQFEDEIEGATEIVSSAVTVRSSDSYWTVGEWEMPMPADVPLQLIPETDLSSLSAGDEVVMAVYRDGERVTPPADASFLALNETTEVPGTVGDDGSLRVTLPEAGMWVIRSKHLEPLAEAGEAYADLEGRIDDVTFTATTAVQVDP